MLGFPQLVSGVTALPPGLRVQDWQCPWFWTHRDALAIMSLEDQPVQAGASDLQHESPHSGSAETMKLQGKQHEVALHW